jgi:peroxiredoxin
MKYYILILVSIFLFACDNSNKFTVEGTIADAAGKTLYIEYNNLTKSILLDSVKLKTDGKYSFSAARPQFPDFYRLVLDGKYIIFAIDSTETVGINSQYAGFAMNYTVHNSTESLEIQRLRQSLNAIQLLADSALKAPPEMRPAFTQRIENQIITHKDTAKALILKNVRSLAAYFALHQQINGAMLFSPYDTSDRVYYNAVANAFHVFMPEYDRSKAMYINVIDALKKTREQKEREKWRNIIAEKGVGFIDITLPDRTGAQRKLSDVARGKTVLIDFSAFEMPETTDYTFLLREMFNKYSAKGFTIYQISLDKNRILWERATENLPWTCVRGDDGANNLYLGSYDVKNIPTLFLLNKKGEIVSRITNLKMLEEVIAKNL